MGSQGSLGSQEHFDILLEPLVASGGGVRHNGAGGRFKVPGDYLYRTWQSNGFAGGSWGIFRVEPEIEDDQKSDIVTVLRAALVDPALNLVSFEGSNSPVLGAYGDEAQFATDISLYPGAAVDGACHGDRFGRLSNLPAPTGPMQTWTWTGSVSPEFIASPVSETVFCVSSNEGGVDTVRLEQHAPCQVSRAILAVKTKVQAGANPALGE